MSWVLRPSSLLYLVSFLVFQLFSIFPLAAILDTNANSLSDVWEKQYNANQLFTLTNPSHAPTADPDQDGWTNASEAIAGTNPFSAAEPNGKTVLKITNATTAHSYILTWPVIPGKNYRLQASTNLHFWLNVDHVVDIAPGQTTALIGLTAKDPENPTAPVPPKLFYRIKVTDSDEDSDQLTTAEEIALGTNPTAAQTSQPLPDHWLASHFLDQILTQGIASIEPNADPDNDGETNISESQAGSSPHDPTSTPADIDGDGIANNRDADPNEKKINWARASEGSYIVVDLQMQPLAQYSFLPFGRENVPAVINDQNQICREPFLPLGETTPATWDGLTFPIVWQPLHDFTDVGDEPYSFDDFSLSFNNDGHTYHALHLDNGTDNSPGSRIVSVQWSGLLSSPSRYGDYSVEYTHRTVQSRFANRATVEDIWHSDTSPATVTRTIIAPNINLTATGEPNALFLSVPTFNLYSSAPSITRTGKILVEQNNTLKIGEDIVPSNTIYGITADPHDSTLVAMPGGMGTHSASTMRNRNGNWEEMPMPGIMDMNASGVGITFPDQQIWSNGKSLSLDDHLKDSGWNSFKAEQINEKGIILGSAKINDAPDCYPVMLIPADMDIIHHATGELAEAAEDNPNMGGLVAVKRGDFNREPYTPHPRNSAEPITQLIIRKNNIIPNLKWKLRFVNSGAFTIWKDFNLTMQVISDVTEFDATNDVTLYFVGLNKSAARCAESVQLIALINGVSNVADSVSFTVVEAQVLVQLRFWIREGWITVPLHPFANNDGNTIAGGDLRDNSLEWQPVRGAAPISIARGFRVAQEAVIMPFKELNLSFHPGIRRDSAANVAGATSLWDKRYSVPNPTLPYSTTNELLPTAISRGIDSPSTNRMHINSSRPNDRQGKVQFYGAANDPLVMGAPDIDWNINVIIDGSDPLNLKYEITGSHDDYPSVEINMKYSANDPRNSSPFTTTPQPYHKLHKLPGNPLLLMNGSLTNINPAVKGMVE